MAAEELRFAFVLDDLEAGLGVFRDALGLDVVETFRSDDGGTGVILRLPAATLDLFDIAYGDHVDEIEVGRRVRPSVRVAVKVPDLDAASRAITSAGAEAEAPPVVTPWGDRNRRFHTREGMQLTLFETPPVK